MYRQFRPRNQEIYIFSSHVLMWIQTGTGVIEVDFKPYSRLEDRFIFLAPHQPIRFVFGTFDVNILEFPENTATRCQDYRVLFKHLLSLGYIDPGREKGSLLSGIVQESKGEILDASTQHWFELNPFNARKEEYQLIFDIKDAIDAQFQDHVYIPTLTESLQETYHHLHRLVKRRLGVSIKKLAQKKLLIESQKEIALTDKPIQEIAYDMGFRDPAYFNRFFKKQTQTSPIHFRKEFGHLEKDYFLEDLRTLIHLHHREQRSTTFYAQQMFMSVQTLSRKVKQKLHLTVGELVSQEIIVSAKHLLKQSTVKETGYELGFEEANHFSAYFKKHTGLTPTDFLSKKSNQLI